MPDAKPTGSLLARIVMFHFCGLVVFTSWAFGGQAPWVRDVIAGWGGVGVLLFVIACLQRNRPADQPSHPALRCLWPLWLYDVLVIASCFNPGFKELQIAGETSLVMADPITWLPTAARPWLAWKELWQFNAIVLSSFNLFLVLHRRGAIRTVLFVLAGNAVVLAVFGTFQKLSGAGGLWMGLVPSPNKHFFSTFIYHNHWGSFALLNTAVCLGLLFHSLRRIEARNIWHSPVLMGAVVTLLLAASILLSTSRSCTALVSLLILGALGHFLLRLIRRRRHTGSIWLPVTGLIVATLIAVAAVAYLGRGVIAQRAQLTSEQLARIAKEDTLNSRLTLYRDTWRMAAEKPWFGWGLESYAHVFRVFNTQRTAETVFWIPFYAEAHNDWLQSLAETGFLGTGLLLLLGWLPLRGHWHRALDSPIPRYLLTGCGLVLAYAWLEFPFANPAVMMMFCGCWYLAARHLALDAAHE
jgi:hypothetical protein